MGKGYTALMIALVVLTLLSLAANAALIFSLLEARQVALTTIADARGMLADITGETFTYTFKINEEIPFQSTFPVEEEFTVPFNSVIPINTTVAVPIDLGFTTYNLRVPINMSFPIDMEFTVPISMAMDVDVTVPIEMEVPVEIPMAEIPLVRYVYEFDAKLAKLEQQLQNPLNLSTQQEP